MKASRLKEIQDYIINKETVSMEDLCSKFNISMNTARRDIGELVTSGIVKKVYGGVTVCSRPPVQLNEGSVKNREVKIRIAERAAEYVCDGDIIYIDSGTTTAHMIKYLKDKTITIITNNLNIIVAAVPFNNIDIIAIGGNFSRKTNAFNGFNNSLILKDFNINKAFLSTIGISIENGLTNEIPLEYQIKKAVVEKSSNIFILADNTKFNVSSMLTFCELQKVDCLITDKEPPSNFVEHFQQIGVNVSVAPLCGNNT